MTVLGRLQFAAPAALAAAKGEKPKPQKRQKVKNDPKLVAAARELRDRWLERVNDLPLVSRGKYEVARLVDESAPVSRPVPLLLPAA